MSDNMTPKSSDQQPMAVPAVLKPTQLKQAGIILLSAIILSVSSCAGMIATFATHEILFTIATVAFIIGLAAIPVTFVWTIVILISRSARKRAASK